MRPGSHSCSVSTRALPDRVSCPPSVGARWRWSREQGLDTVRLEVLVPRQWPHPSKEFPKAWCTRIGYRPVRTGQFEESYPELAPLLATP